MCYEKNDDFKRSSMTMLSKPQICKTCKNKFYSKDERKQCEECDKNDEREKTMIIKKCPNCEKEFEDNGNHRRLCPNCYRLKQRDIQRERASTIEGYFKQILSNIYNANRGKRFGDPDITLEQLINLYHKQDGKCAISGIIMELGDKRNGRGGNPFALSIDRIDSFKPYTIDNIELVIIAVNYFKGKYPLGVLLDITKQIYETNCLEMKQVK